jgi:hypothetical protein
VYEINVPFFFGAAEKFKDTLHALRDLVRRKRRDGDIDEALGKARRHVGLVVELTTPVSTA